MATTWEGMMGIMSAKWDKFKVDIMDSGVFDWLKAAFGIVMDYTKNWGNVSKDVGTTIIAVFEGVVKGVGWVIEAWKGMKLVVLALKSAFAVFADFTLKVQIGRAHV